MSDEGLIPYDMPPAFNEHGVPFRNLIPRTPARTITRITVSAAFSDGTFFTVSADDPVNPELSITGPAIEVLQRQDTALLGRLPDPPLRSVAVRFSANPSRPSVTEMRSGRHENEPSYAWLLSDGNPYGLPSLNPARLFASDTLAKQAAEEEIGPGLNWQAHAGGLYILRNPDGTLGTVTIRRTRVER